MNNNYNILKEEYDRVLLEDYVSKIVRSALLQEWKKAKKGSNKEKKSGDTNGFRQSLDTSVGELKNAGLNLAQYAYRLWPDMDKDTARSKFYKKMKNEPVKDGYSKKKKYRYKFTPEEATELSNMVGKKLGKKL